MKSTNPYRPPSTTAAGVQEKSQLPISISGCAILDIVVGAVIAIGAFCTWYGAGFGSDNGAFVIIFLTTEVIAGLLLAVSLLGTGYRLLLKRSHAWRLLFVSQSTLAFLVFFTYAGLVYVLIDTWGYRSMMYSGGDPQSLGIVTLIFVVVQTASVIPVIILIRHRPDRHIVSARSHS